MHSKEVEVARLQDEDEDGAHNIIHKHEGAESGEREMRRKEGWREREAEIGRRFADKNARGGRGESEGEWRRRGGDRHAAGRGPKYPLHDAVRTCRPTSASLDVLHSALVLHY